jgi:hypothetical protein
MAMLDTVQKNHALWALLGVGQLVLWLFDFVDYPWKLVSFAFLIVWGAVVVASQLRSQDSKPTLDLHSK